MCKYSYMDAPERSIQREQSENDRKSDWRIVRKFQGLFSAEEAVEKIIEIHMEKGE